MALRISQNTLSPSLSDTITIDGLPFDLTGATVQFRMRAVGSDSLSTLKVNAAASIVGSAINGAVRYDWQAADLDTAGDFLGWWNVTLPGGKTQDHPEFTLEVQAHGKTAGSLCEVSDVREFLQKPGGDRNQDTIIETLITSASAVINSYAGREFADMGTLTRRFRVEGVLVDLTPYELRSVDVVSLNPEATTPTTLTAIDGYDLQPYGPQGTYQFLRVASQYRSPSTFYGQFGYGLIDITGDWGMAEIPVEVRHACVVTVGMWMQRDIQAFTQTFNITEDRLERPQVLPSTVLRILDRYRQIGVA